MSKEGRMDGWRCNGTIIISIIIIMSELTDGGAGGKENACIWSHRRRGVEDGAQWDDDEWNGQRSPRLTARDESSLISSGDASNDSNTVTASASRLSQACVAGRHQRFC